MSFPFIFRAGTLALACASTASAGYVILDDFSGPNFFENFYFNTTLDPTHGFVEYIGAGNSLLNSLAYYDPTTDTAIMRVDDNKTYTPGVDTGRPSIRAQTINTYQYGLFILDLAHMPGNACGSWPAFWTTSMDHWPEQGEIDIIENVHLAVQSEQTLHTGPVFPGDVCEVVGNVNTNPGQETGTQISYNCMWNATTSDYGTQTQYSGQGCSAANNNPNNFGTSFNAVQGGVYAMEWNDEIIQIWSWENGYAPADIANGTPDPLSWGNPIFTTWGGNCDIARHFIDHTVVFDTTFCGDWGNAAWATSGCYSEQYPTCSDYVGANPGVYSETYWAVRSLKVYQFSNAATSSSTTAAASTTSTTSTSSAAATTTPSTTTEAPSTPTAPSSPLATVGNWEEVGCFTEATLSRALTLGSKINYSTMDLEICSAYCYNLGALYFGVEYGGECYCGNELEPGSVPATDGGCDMPCDGNLDETCGGRDRLNVFIYVPSVASTTSSTTSSTAAATSISSSSSSSTSSVASSSSSAAPSSSSAASRTSPAALSTSTLGSSTSSAAPSTSSSTTTTPAAPSLPLSDPQHVETVGSCQRIGCYTEGYEIRALSAYSNVDYAYMSPEICGSLCPEYTYFGVEYGGECYCGNTINNGSTIVPDAQCDMPCGGFPTEYCGAGVRLDMYYCGSSSSSQSSSSSVSGSQSTSTADPTSSPSSSSSSASPTSSTSSDPPSPSSSTNSDPPSPSSSSSSDPPPPSSSTSSYPDPPSSSTSSDPASPTNSTSSNDPASTSTSTSSDPTNYPVASSSTNAYLYSNSSSSHSQSYTTETITTTTCRTISSCAPTITNCPYGKVVTDIIVLTTTYCPGNPTPTPSVIATPSAPAQKTLTIYTTTVYTVTSCAPAITNCPAKLGAVITDTIIAYTTVCPIEEAISKGLITAPAGIPTSTSTAYKSFTVVNLITQTVLPVPYTPSPYVPSVNSTGIAAGSTAPTYSASPAPSSSPVEYKGGASGVLAGKGSGLAMVIVFVAAAVFL